jgi:adenine-specific DNA-methyltransferase
MNKDIILNDLKSLIEKYEKVKKNLQIKKYTEEETKKDFILPLFKILGWNVFDKNEVSAEEQIVSSGRVDYGFYINTRVKFYLEAKPLKADLNIEEFAKQAIRYSFNKGVTWAVLTDFESIKVFNAQAISKYLGDKLYFEIPYYEYIKRLDQLLLLSRESFQSDLIDTEAKKVGKMLQKIPVGELLFEDLEECREILIHDLSLWNENVDNELMDEGVQKILDRLIFLRVAEDRKIEPPTLIPLIRVWESTDRKTPLYKSMISTFRELDSVYNSNLFSKHPFEDWEDYSDATKRVIRILYGKEGYYEYDFKDMPADVLGGVYENYLGYKLSQSKKGLSVGKNAKKRKEQGIYYTPTFIVDYIVRNALKPVLDRCKSVNDLKKIKVLDPACGSGSFLIKALEIIADKYRDFNCTVNEFTKIEIIMENLYGVDLDVQAVEIARLNLLINTLEQRGIMPSLDKNIKNGNSLISGTDEELEKYFGKNFRGKKPFNWKEEFPEVFKQGGFDVIIGNPPYIKEFINKSAFDGLHNSSYYQGKMDIWTMFACISIDLLKPGGILSFIAPNNWVSNAGASIFRNKVLREGELKIFIDFNDYKVFEQAGIQTMIFVFEKKKPDRKYNINYLRIANKNLTEDKLVSNLLAPKIKINIEPEKLIDKNITFGDSAANLILDRMQNKKNFEILDDEISNGIHHHHDCVNRERKDILGDKFSVGDGIFVLSDSEKRRMNLTEEELKIIKPSYTTEQIGRWYSKSNNKEWVIYTDSSFKDSAKINLYPNIKKHLDKFKKVITSDNKPYGLHRAKKEKFFKGEKIIALRKCLKPSFAYVNFDSYVSATFYIVKSERINQKYLIALLNSRIVAFWLKNKGKMQGNNYQLDKEPLIGIPICVGTKEQQDNIAKLANRMILLNKEMHEVVENSNKWNIVKNEIEKTDKKIDKEVYGLYGLTPEEIAIVEKKNED